MSGAASGTSLTVPGTGWGGGSGGQAGSARGPGSSGRQSGARGGGSGRPPSPVSGQAAEGRGTAGEVQSLQGCGVSLAGRPVEVGN